MRILVLANVPPHAMGGAENQAARLIEAWVGLGHHVEVAGNRIPDGTVRLGSAEVTIHNIATLDRCGRAGRAASYFLSLARLLLRHAARFDVAYSRSFGDAAITIAVLKAAGVLKLPLFAVPIGARSTGDTCFIRSIPGWRMIAALLDRHCEGINVIAPAIESELAALGISTPRLTRIPNGIPLQSRLGRTAVMPVRRLVWTGRMSREKGLDLLLHALAAIARDGSDFTLELVGDGRERPALEALSRELGLSARMCFTGVLAGDAVRARLAAADVMLLPSRNEGMSNTVLEGMEAGLPVLLTRCGGIDTYIDEGTGWVCEPDDPGSLVAALTRMFATPDAELLAMGRSARALVEREFEIREIARRNLEAMAAVVASRGER